jgi:hypothetical protein
MYDLIRLVENSFVTIIYVPIDYGVHVARVECGTGSKLQDLSLSWAEALFTLKLSLMNRHIFSPPSSVPL